MLVALRNVTLGVLVRALICEDDLLRYKRDGFYCGESIIKRRSVVQVQINYS